MNECITLPANQNKQKLGKFIIKFLQTSEIIVLMIQRSELDLLSYTRTCH